MEEDSKRRRERLKAMRTVAAQAEASSYVQTSSVSGGLLANPLLESPTTDPSHETSLASPRFDFYTDPVAAFSANKKNGAVGNQAPQGYSKPHGDSTSPMPRFSSPLPGPRNPDTANFHAHQIQHNYSPNQIMHQNQVPYNSSAPYTSPRAGPFPMPMHQGTPHAANYRSYAPHTEMPNQYPIRNGNPNFQPVGNHNFNYGQGRPPSPLIGNSPRFVSGRGVSHTNMGRGQGQTHSSSRGQVYGRGGGRAQGFRFHGVQRDAALRPEPFYDRSMIEDPWQHLEPVLWKGLGGSSDSWLPKSVSSKKPRVPDSSNKPSSQQNLAAYLAAAFNEAANDAPST